MGKVGRQVGSGEQLPSIARSHKSRSNLAAIGAAQMDFSLNPNNAATLCQFIKLWACPHHKEAIQQANRLRPRLMRLGILLRHFIAQIASAHCSGNRCQRLAVPAANLATH